MGTSSSSTAVFGPLTQIFTVCHVARYSSTTSSNNGRIITTVNTASASTWASPDTLLGHYAGSAGYFYVSGWISSANPTNGPSAFNANKWAWQCFTVSSVSCIVTNDGLYQPCNWSPNPSAPVGDYRVGINTGSGSMQPTSGWQVAELIVWNRQLLASEISNVNTYFQNTYSLNYKTSGFTNLVPTQLLYTNGVSLLSGGNWTPSLQSGTKIDATGTAISFDGSSSSYLSLPAWTFGSKPLTIALWVRVDAASTYARIYEFSSAYYAASNQISLIM